MCHIREPHYDVVYRTLRVSSRSRRCAPVRSRELLARELNLAKMFQILLKATYYCVCRAY